MTICERINERGEVMGIDYWADGKVKVVQSHGYSTLYMLKYMLIKQEKPYLTASEISRRTNLYVSVYHKDNK